MSTTYNITDIRTIIDRMSNVDTSMPARYWVTSKRAFQQDYRAMRSMGISEVLRHDEFYSRNRP